MTKVFDGPYVLSIPPELWVRIFRFATELPTSSRLYEPEYVPFHEPPNEFEDVDFQGADLHVAANVEVKLALVLVCKKWKALASPFLYEDVRASHGFRRLQDPGGLARLKLRLASEGWGKWVRRVEVHSTVDSGDLSMPFSRLEPISHFSRISPFEVLKSCPRVEAVKGHYMLPPPENDSVSVPQLPMLPSLKRVDWWDTGPNGFRTLIDLLLCAHNLRYLSLGTKGELIFTPGYRHLPAIELLQLSTLRLANVSSQLLTIIDASWSFPNLRNLIVDVGVVVAALELPMIAKNVETIEFTKNGASFDGEVVLNILERCPNLRELNFHVEFAYLSPLDPFFSHDKLECIGLHASYELPPLFFSDSAMWKHFALQFAVLTGSDLPALKQFVLYGEWDPIMADERFKTLQEAIRDSKRELKRGDRATGMAPRRLGSA